MFQEPNSYFIITACKSPIWCEAMALELATFEDNNTWQIVALPPSKMVISCEWLYRVKFKPDVIVDGYKFIWYKKDLIILNTFASVAKMVTIQVLLPVSVVHNWYDITQMDVTNMLLYMVLLLLRKFIDLLFNTC